MRTGVVTYCFNTLVRVTEQGSDWDGGFAVCLTGRCCARNEGRAPIATVLVPSAGRGVEKASRTMGLIRVIKTNVHTSLLLPPSPCSCAERCTLLSVPALGVSY